MLGKYDECTASLNDALELTRKQQSISDRAIVEDRLAIHYVLRGKFEDAKAYFSSSLSDAIATSNLVLQADVLVAVATLQQGGGHLDRALKTINQALDLSRRGKSLYIESRTLGELSRLQLLAGEQVDARTSIERALQIDQINHYQWEPGHLLYLANVDVAESKTKDATEVGLGARNLAIRNEDFLTFVQSSVFLGVGFVYLNRTDEGLQLLELSRKGLSEQNKPLFQHQDTYTKYVLLPYIRIVFLEALGNAYQAAKRPDDALRNWQELYETATSTGFTLARGESAHKLATLYQIKKDLTRAVEFYAIAAATFSAIGNEKEKNECLNSEEVLLFQLGDKEKALSIEEDLLSSVTASKDVTSQFTCDLIVAELLDETQRIDRIQSALTDADSLVNSDVTVVGVQPNLIVELYLRLADLYGKQQDIQQKLIALEKAITPALALASAVDKTKNGKPLATVVEQLEATMTQKKSEYQNDKTDVAEALIRFEILQYFEEIDAAWKGKHDDYTKRLDSDPILIHLLQLPPKLISQDGGAVLLEKNIETMGPPANRVRPLILGLLVEYYVTHQRPDLTVKFAKEALALKGWEGEIKGRWGVAISCQLAYALMMQKEIKSAVDTMNQCMAGAMALGLPQLLIAAHQINVFVLDAAGKHSEAQDSIRFLLTNKPDDPNEYVELASMKGQQGNWAEAIEAWRSALKLYETRNDKSGAAQAHLQLANSPTLAADANEKRIHLEAADELYREVGSIQGRLKSQTALGAYYATRKNEKLSRRYFEGALDLARDSNKEDLRAFVLSEMGQAFETSEKLSDAATYYGDAADIYEHENDLVNEAFQLKNKAIVLSRTGRPDDALQAIMKAKGVADKSGNWVAKYWVRRTLGAIYIDSGQFQDAINTLKEAKQITTDVNQPLNSAWAALQLAAGLEAIGNWEEALQQINEAIPVLKQFKDTDDETTAFIELMAIYGGRESDVKDLSKALEFYQMAFELVSKTHPDRTPQLNLDLTEIYWQQGRYPLQATKPRCNYDSLSRASSSSIWR